MRGVSLLLALAEVCLGAGGPADFALAVPPGGTARIDGLPGIPHLFIDDDVIKYFLSTR